MPPHVDLIVGEWVQVGTTGASLVLVQNLASRVVYFRCQNTQPTPADNDGFVLPPAKSGPFDLGAGDTLWARPLDGPVSDDFQMQLYFKERV